MRMKTRMKQRMQMRRKIKRIRTQESCKKLYVTVVEIGLLWRLDCCGGSTNMAFHI